MHDGLHQSKCNGDNTRAATTADAVLFIDCNVRGLARCTAFYNRYAVALKQWVAIYMYTNLNKLIVQKQIIYNWEIIQKKILEQTIFLTANLMETVVPHWTKTNNSNKFIHTSNMYIQIKNDGQCAMGQVLTLDELFPTRWLIERIPLECFLCFYIYFLLTSLLNTKKINKAKEWFNDSCKWLKSISLSRSSLTCQHIIAFSTENERMFIIK